MNGGKVEYLDPSELLPNPNNFRRHGKRQTTAVARSLDKYGWLETVLYNRQTGHLINGHLRVAEAIKRGDAEIPVMVIDVDISTQDEILVNLDKLGDLAEIDEEALARLITREVGAEEDFEPFAWNDKELDRFDEIVTDTDSAEAFSEGLGIEEDDDAVDDRENLATVRFVQIFLNQETEPVFKRWVNNLADHLGTSTVTDTVYRAVGDLHDLLCPEGS